MTLCKPDEVDESLRSWPAISEADFKHASGVSRVRRLIESHEGPPVRIRVTGSVGKTTSVYRLGHSLMDAGIRVGWFTSPWIGSVRDGVRVLGEVVPVETWLAALSSIRNQADKGLTQFEAATAAAWLILGEAAIDVALFETGFGGPADAVCALPAQLGLVTPIEKDHVGLLGSTRRDIAESEFQAVADCDAVFNAAQSDIAVTKIPHPDLYRHLSLNQALTGILSWCSERLQIRVPPLVDVSPPLRSEPHPDQARLILDNAHTPSRLATTLGRSGSLALIVLACGDQRDWQAMVRFALRRYTEASFWFTDFDSPSDHPVRAVPPEDLDTFARVYARRSFHTAISHTDLPEALSLWFSKQTGNVLATGSHYLAGFLRLTSFGQPE